MTRTCELTGTQSMFGQNVSHSNRKTKTKFLPNLCKVNLLSDSLKKQVDLRITAKTLRSIDAKGGLDNFILSRSAKSLTNRAMRLKKAIKAAMSREGNKQQLK